jgi:hypothetical protein
MHTRVSPWTVLGCAVLVGGTLLACKGKKGTTGTTGGGETPEVPNKPPEPPPPPEFMTKTYSVGDTAKALDYSLAVDNVKECRPKYYFSKPKKGSMWLGVEMVVEATTDKQIWSNPTYAKVVDGDGLTYNYTYATTKDCDPGLRATQLNKGEKAKGWVVFEVPEKASGLKITYNPSMIGAPQQVKFDLGR